MTESVAILLYLGEKYGEGRLMPPPGSWERGQMMMRMLFLASQEHPAFGLWLRPFRWLDDGDEQGRLKAAAEAYLGTTVTGAVITVDGGISLA